MDNGECWLSRTRLGGESRDMRSNKSIFAKMSSRTKKVASGASFLRRRQHVQKRGQVMPDASMSRSFAATVGGAFSFPSVLTFSIRVMEIENLSQAAEKSSLGPKRRQNLLPPLLGSRLARLSKVLKVVGTVCSLAE